MLPPMILIALCAAVLTLGFIRRIPEGQAYSLRRIGGHTRILGAGIHLVFPLIEHIEHKIRLTGNTLALNDVVADGQHCHGAVYFQVIDPERADAIIDDVPALLHARSTALLCQTNMSAGSLEHRQWLKQTLNKEWNESGLLITRVELALNE